MLNLETERLLLRPFVIEDVNDWFEMYSNPNVTRFIGGRTLGTRHDAEMDLAERLVLYEEAFAKGRGIWAVTLKGSGELIGKAIYAKLTHSKPYETEDPPNEIGWHLKETHWGCGYGTEFGRVLLDLALEREGKAIAICDLENVASARIMEKIGMTYQGLTDRYYDATVKMYKAERKRVAS